MAWRLKRRYWYSNIRVWKIKMKVLIQLGSCWMNRNVTPRGISLSVIQATVPVFTSGISFCTVPKEGDMISGLFHQGMEQRLSEEIVAASCACLSSGAGCFVSPWSQAVARWYWERVGVPRVTAEHRLCEMAQWEEVLKKSQTTTTKPYAEEETEEDQTTVHCVLDKNNKSSCSHSQTQQQN